MSFKNWASTQASDPSKPADKPEVMPVAPNSPVEPEAAPAKVAPGPAQGS